MLSRASERLSLPLPLPLPLPSLLAVMAVPAVWAGFSAPRRRPPAPLRARAPRPTPSLASTACISSPSRRGCDARCIGRIARCVAGSSWGPAGARSGVVVLALVLLLVLLLVLVLVLVLVWVG